MTGELIQNAFWLILHICFSSFITALKRLTLNFLDWLALLIMLYIIKTTTQSPSYG